LAALGMKSAAYTTEELLIIGEIFMNVKVSYMCKKNFDVLVFVIPLNKIGQGTVRNPKKISTMLNQGENSAGSKRKN
jgi:hypothetical protein